MDKGVVSPVKPGELEAFGREYMSVPRQLSPKKS